MTRHGKQAVVVGSGIAGLLTARVLTNHFEQITIIERDQVPVGPTFRAGVPQSRHVHGLLLRGRQILEQLFPGIGVELEAAGAQSLDWIKDVAFWTADGLMQRFPSAYHVLTCSRELLEWTVRQRVASQATIRYGQEVIGLVADEQNRQITGVRVRLRNAEAHVLGAEEVITADLVVDASGRSSPALDWLKALGFNAPQEQIIDGHLGYATRCYQRPEAYPADWRVLALLATWPHIPRGGIIFPIEGDKWVVTVAGTRPDYPPTDEAGFLSFVEGMALPQFAEAIKAAAPLSPIYGYQRMDNRWLHYERLSRWPGHFLVCGDAVCSLNPYYGQGMTVIAQGALSLDQVLHKGASDGWERHFQRTLAKVYTTPWVLATGEDLRNPTTEGGKPDQSARLLYRYFDGVKRAVTKSPKVMQTYVEVAHLLKPPSALFQPEMAVRVLGQGLSKHKAREDHTPLQS